MRSGSPTQRHSSTVARAHELRSLALELLKPKVPRPGNGARGLPMLYPADAAPDHDIAVTTTCGIRSGVTPASPQKSDRTWLSAGTAGCAHEARAVGCWHPQPRGPEHAIKANRHGFHTQLHSIQRFSLRRASRCRHAMLGRAQPARRRVAADVDIGACTENPAAPFSIPTGRAFLVPPQQQRSSDARGGTQCSGPRPRAGPAQRASHCMAEGSRRCRRFAAAKCVPTGSCRQRRMLRPCHRHPGQPDRESTSGRRQQGRDAVGIHMSGSKEKPRFTGNRGLPGKGIRAGTFALAAQATSLVLYRAMI